MKKKIKIKFTDFWSGFDTSDNLFIELLKEKYDIEISEDPEYIFCSVFGRDYLKYNGVRICFTGENLRTDFNVCDYGIGFDWMEFGDRFLRFPVYALYTDAWEKARNKHIITDRDGYFNQHSRFCNFVYSNNLYVIPQREQILDVIDNYKEVDCGGRYRNNVGGPVEDKTRFLQKYKFTIAVENASTSGYTTEKLIEAWAAGTIPIYYGNPDVGKEFNTKAFINCHEFGDLDAIVKKVRELDENDDLFWEMMMQPIYNNSAPYDLRETMLPFLTSIIDQEYEKAFRRDRFGWGRLYENRLKKEERLRSSLPVKIYKRLKR